MLALDRLLVPTDFSACAEQALVHAKRFARSHDAELHLLHVIPVAPAHPMLGVQATPAERTDQVRNRLAEAVEAHDLDETSSTLVVEHGEGVASTLLNYAEAQNVDLLVIGTHGRRGVRRLLLGSTAEEILRRADRPVLAVRQREEGDEIVPVGRILVPVDLSAHSKQALWHAVALAQRYDARIDLVHVVEPFSSYDPAEPYQAALPSDANVLPAVEENVRDELQALAGELPLPDEKVRVYVGQGAPVPFIVDVATDEDVDLIVLSSHGRTGLERFLLGSVAEKILRTAPCPVFVVKSYGRSLVSQTGVVEEAGGTDRSSTAAHEPAES